MVVTSSATGAGMDELAAAVRRWVPPEPEQPTEAADVAEHRVYRPGSGDAFRVSGPRVDRLMQRFDLENEEAAAHVEHRLDRMGVLRALEENGFAPGDDLEIGGMLLELDLGE